MEFKSFTDLIDALRSAGTGLKTLVQLLQIRGCGEAFHEIQGGVHNQASGGMLAAFAVALQRQRIDGTTLSAC